MKAKNTIVSVGLMMLALSATSQFVEAGQRDSRGRDRNGRESQGQSRERGGGSSERSRRDGGQAAQAPSQQPREAGPSARRGDGGGPRIGTPSDRSRDDRAAADPRARNGARDSGRGSVGQAVPRRDGQPPVFDRDGRGNGNRRDAFRYDPYRDNRRYDNGYRGAPRLLPRRLSPRHYYGSGGGFNVYFGLGSGYLYGSPYYGRVYGYTAPPVYGGRVYYGDVRLQVRPRNAAVYVDGYYAGVVDDFDGVFQRLTIEGGPHEIELAAPGLEPQFYDVYVDPTRTVTIRTDLYPY